MKFVCDNCKAKYQIGDEKVAGKTLRMKCRRCGHLIQVAASVTESSVSTKLPTEQATGSAPAPIPAPTMSSLGTMGPLEDPPGADDGGATIVKPSPLFIFENQQRMTPPPPAPSHAGRTPAPSASIPRPLHAPPPAPSGGGSFGPASSPPAPRIVPPARASLRSTPPVANASSPGAPRAPLRSTSGGSLAAIAQAHAQPAVTPIRPNLGVAQIPAHTPSSPALYGGFVQAVNAPSAAPSPMPTEDWYVGISGVPLGPVRLSVLRDKAAQGQVDPDSLVWREGFEEWQPIKKVPGLLELVEEAKRNSRVSATPVPPAHSSSPYQTGAAAALAAGRSQGARTSAPLGLQIPEPASSHPFDLVRSSQPPPAVESNLGDRPASLDVVKDPFASSAGAPPHAAPPHAASPQNGFGLTTTAGYSNEKVATKSPSVPPESAFGTKKKKGLHPMVWAFIAMAAAFGGVAAWAVFLRKPEVVYVPQGGQNTAEGVTNAPPGPPTSTTSDPTAEASTTAEPVPTGSQVVVFGPRPTGSLKPGETAAPIDTTGFGGTSTGPKTNDPQNTGGGAGPLSAGEAQGVVAKNTPRVRRNCWDPQVSGRSADAPNSVKVNATLNVAPDGSVKSANVSGGNEKHYPGLVGCVSSAVRGWKFPPSGEGGTVVVPFGFNAQ